MPWIFTAPDGKEVDYSFRSRLRVLEEASGCISWGSAGGGLFQTYHFIAAAAVARGELVEVLQAYGGRSRHLSARVRAFVDFMLERLRTPAGPASEHPAAIRT